MLNYSIISKVNFIRNEFGIVSSSAVNLDYLIEKLNIVLAVKPLKEGVVGACKVVGLNKLIVLNSNNKYLDKRRFTLAHEIGHIILHQGKHACESDIFNTRKMKHQIEAEANCFASEILLPSLELKKHLKCHDISFNMAETLCKKYDTSLSSTILALIDVCDEESAVIQHDGKTIDWIYKSSNFRYKIETAIVGSEIMNEAYSCKNQAVGEVDSEIWIDNHNLRCIENTKYLKNYKKYITIINLVADYE